LVQWSQSLQKTALTTSPPTLKELLQDVGNGHNLMAGCVKLPKDAATSATHVCPSVPECTERILPSHQWSGCVAFLMRSKSSTNNIVHHYRTILNLLGGWRGTHFSNVSKSDDVVDQWPSAIALILTMGWRPSLGQIFFLYNIRVDKIILSNILI